MITPTPYLQHYTRKFKLEKWSQFRTTDWVNYLEYPELTNKEVNRFLGY